MRTAFFACRRRTTHGAGAFSVTRYGDADPTLLLEEFIGAFELDSQAVIWSECDRERWQIRLRDGEGRTYLGATFGNLNAARASADEINRRADGWTAAVAGPTAVRDGHA
jgi:hypothetical protein